MPKRRRYPEGSYGGTCPVCRTPASVTHTALVPRNVVVGGNVTVEEGYGVCIRCMADQWDQRYAPGVGYVWHDIYTEPDGVVREDFDTWEDPPRPLPGHPKYKGD